MATPSVKPVNDDGWEDVDWEDVTPPNTTEPAQTEEPSLLSRGWHAIADPLTDAPSRFARSVGDWMTTPELDDSRFTSYAKGFLGGATEGVGNVASSLTSPISLATLGFGGTEYAAARAGLPQIAKLASLGTRVASVPVALHGGYETIRPDATLGERAMGVAELAGGGAGMFHTPATVKPRTIDVEIPPGQTRSFAEIDKRMNELINKSVEGKLTAAELKEAQVLNKEWRNHPEFGKSITHERNINTDDPNFNQGIGNPELAGSTPYPRGQGPGATKPRELSAGEEQGISELDRFLNSVHGENAPTRGNGIFTTEAEKHGVVPRNQGKPSVGPELRPDTNIDDASFLDSQTWQRDPDAKGPFPPGKLAEIASNVTRRPQEVVGFAGSLTPTPEPINVTPPKPRLSSPVKENPVTPNPVKNAVDPEGTIIDPYAGYRSVPIGTKYTISPENMSRRKLADAIKLGFEYQGLDDKGRIILRKVRESPAVKPLEVEPYSSSAWFEAANLPRTIMASMDLSAPLRQGLGLIHKKAFWTSLPKMIKALGSENAYQQMQKSIYQHPLFKRTVNAKGQIIPSFAERAGLKLTDLDTAMNLREESMLSRWAQKVPGVRASNRAYTIFLNKLRADTFIQMTKDYGAFSGIDMKNNLALATRLADFINTASGRGKLSGTIPGINKTVSLETSANALASVFFSPRLMASRLGMMAKGTQALFSPEVYMLRSPSVRREYLKSLFSVAAVAGSFVTLAKAAGASVETDPASSDFGKVKIGNTRIDPYGGFQQYIVLAQRMMPHLDLSQAGLGEIGGDMKSTTTEKEYNLSDPGFGRSNRAEVLLRFFRSKTNPIINFGWGLMAGQREISGKPMDLSTLNPYENSLAQRFLPMLTQDIYDMIQDETTPPEAKALGTFLATFGMGSQTYGDERNYENKPLY